MQKRSEQFLLSISKVLSISCQHNNKPTFGIKVHENIRENCSHLPCWMSTINKTSQSEQAERLRKAIHVQVSLHSSNSIQT
mmetsp:Transcript_31748/g.47996  ORF Transcript_31748/g.47996 Transcript_31748/m.47996 type:complete len:81 (+) Transcript_31748:156-398(+)